MLDSHLLNHQDELEDLLIHTHLKDMFVAAKPEEMQSIENQSGAKSLAT
jgi:hypothetical protein